MKYVLLIFGIVLVVGGGLSIYSGYDIIEIERGWASVLAGTTAATGGVITIGLALIVRSLDRLRMAQEAARDQVARGAQPEAAEPLVAVPDLPVAHPTLSSTRPVAQEWRDAARAPVGRIEADMMATEVRADSDIGPPNFGAPAPADEAPVEVQIPAMPDRPKPAAKVQYVSRAASAFAEAAAKARSEPPSIAEMRRRVAVDFAAGKSPRLDGTIPAASPRQTMPLRETAFQAGSGSATEGEPDDWLDRALAGVDAAISPIEAVAPPLAPGGAAAPRLDIVGRYEVEGTNYVMFADGSIEAQSEQGIVRFKSMAELKAFFQS